MQKTTAYPITVAHVPSVVAPDGGPDSFLLIDARGQEAPVQQHDFVGSWVAGTRGARGGDMVLLGPEKCLDCFLLAQQEGRIPAPPRGEEEPPVVPVGCGSPAFSGSGFDSSEMASAVTRMAVRATGRTAYPSLDHDWAVLDFLSEPGRRQGNLGVDPNCGHRR